MSHREDFRECCSVDNPVGRTHVPHSRPPAIDLTPAPLLPNPSNVRCKLGVEDPVVDGAGSETVGGTVGTDPEQRLILSVGEQVVGRAAILIPIPRFEHMLYA